MAYDFTDIITTIGNIDTHVKKEWDNDSDLYKKIVLLRPLLENRIQSPYIELFGQDNINSLSTNLNNIYSYISNPNAYGQHIDKAIKAIVQVISAIPIPIKGDHAATTKSVIDGLNNSRDNLTSDFDEIKNSIANQNNELERLKRENQNLISNASEQFDNKKKELSDNFISKASDIFTKMEATKAQAEKILGAIGQASVSDSQKRYANNAKILAHWLQGASLGLMLGAIGILFYLFIGIIDNLTWLNFISRLSIGGILLLPSFYLANEAKKQRTKENIYRDSEIKMVAISPYFKNITDGEEKDRVMLDLAQKLLSPTTDTNDSNAVLSDDVIRIIEAVSKIKSDK